MVKVIKMADGGRYYPLDKNGKEMLFRSDKPEPKGGSRYHEDTPTFESVVAGNAGQGIRGDKSYKNGQEEYSLPDDKKSPAKSNQSQPVLYPDSVPVDEPVSKKKGGTVSSASSRADGIAERGKTKGRYL